MPRGRPTGTQEQLRELQQKRMEGKERALQEKREQKANALQCGPYFLFRLDSLNLVLTKSMENGNEWSYYPTLQDALLALLHSLISEGIQKDVKGMLAAIAKAEETVLCSCKNLTQTPL